MLFNSIEFIFIFLPIVWCLYFIFNRYSKYKLAITWLVIASLFFYSWWNPQYFLLIFGSMLFNFLIGTAINKMTVKKPLLIIGIIGNVAVLGYYKYVDFILSTVNTVAHTNFTLLHIMLPLAISFFTFQQIAYLVDTYKGETAHYNFISYALFVTFFPQLIAGPIVHHKEMMPQFEDTTNKKINYENIAKGLFIFCIGLTKKVAIADTFAVWANDGFANYTLLSNAEVWFTSLAYSMQLYFDFSGYCDMAIGIALLFNIKLPVNFFSPYKALSVQQFWRQWHMTLGRFLTQYIYIPLGGSRKGSLRTYINVFAIFFISGLWHGAGWTFIIWGTAHGLAVITNRLWAKYGFTLPKALAWLLTFLFVNFAWVYFRAESVTQANTMVKKMLHFDGSSFKALLTSDLTTMANIYTFMSFSLNQPIFYLGFLVIFFTMAIVGKNSIELVERFTPSIKTLALTQVCLVFVLICIYYLHKNSEFLYFNF